MAGQLNHPADEATPTEQPTPTPQRRWTIAADVGGDTLEDALSMLRHFIDVARSGSRSCVTGGYDRCGTMTVVERPDVTHDTHAEAIERWMAAQPETRSNP